LEVSYGQGAKKYPREFKLEAVKKLQSGQYSIAELARRLVCRSTICATGESKSRSRRTKPSGAGRRGTEAAEIANALALALAVPGELTSLSRTRG